MLKSKKGQKPLKLNELRIGNHVGLAYNPFIISRIISLDEGSSIQLWCNNYVDEIRDIIGVPLTPKLLKRLQIPEYFIRKGISYKLRINELEGITLYYKNDNVVLYYLHELENILIFFSGAELLTSERKFNTVDDECAIG